MSDAYGSVDFPVIPPVIIPVITHPYTILVVWQCSFTIAARDAKGNKRFTAGSDEWDVTMVGTGDWAVDGRIGDFVYTADAPFSAKSVSW